MHTHLDGVEMWSRDESVSHRRPVIDELRSAITSGGSARPVLGCLLVVGVLVRCDGARQAGSSAAVDVQSYDSAGVRIVQNRIECDHILECELPAWGTGRAPELSIGTHVGEAAEQFSDVEGVVRLSGGRLAIADGGSGQIRIFSPSGELDTIMGGRGRGPGEFESLNSLILLDGDTLLAYDSALRRFSIVSSEGRFLHTVRMGWNALPGRILGRIGRAQLVFKPFDVIGPSAIQPRDGVIRGRMPLVAVGRDGHVIDTIATTRTAEYLVEVEGQDYSVISIPFGREMVIAAGGERVWVAENTNLRLEGVGAEGSLDALVMVEHPTRPLTEDQLADELARRLATVDSEGERRRLRRRFNSFQPGSPLPLLTDIAVDRAGGLWVRLLSFSEELNRWIAFSPTGDLRARVDLPLRFEPHEIGHDWVLGVWQDTLDVEYVQLYGLDRSN